MSRSFLIVLPKLMRSGVAPAASTCSISTTEAVSKHEPRLASSASTCAIGIGLHGVEDARVGQRLGEGHVIVAHDVEVEDKARAILEAFLASIAQEFLDTIGHRGIPSKRGSPRRSETSLG